MSRYMLEPEYTLAVLVDYQEKVCRPIWKTEELEQKLVHAVKGLQILEVPLLVTEQYPKGLGQTTEPLRKALENYEPLEKVTFSCMRDPVFRKKLVESGKKDIILMGIEAHVCVQQTALELMEEGYRVFLAEDLVSSRNPYDREMGIERMRDAGCVITTIESLYFELMGSSKADHFREISLHIR